MNHPNILECIGVEKHLDKSEYWLITSYHPYGSLCDYLKAHTVTWPEMCRIAESMARGLMHLHEEIPASKLDGLKPAIAHRDFKSKNVLLKNDLTACIADFGLALTFQPGKINWRRASNILLLLIYYFYVHCRCTMRRYARSSWDTSLYGKDEVHFTFVSFIRLIDFIY